MFNCDFDLVMFETSLVQSESAWHNYDDCRITSEACVLRLVSPAVMCHFTLTNVFAFVTCALWVLLPCPICPSPPPTPPFYCLTHEYLGVQCRPQSSALWSAPQQDRVTQSMTSWSFLRSVSWKPMESKPAFFSTFLIVQSSIYLSLFRFSCYLSEYSVNFSERFPVSSYIPAVVDHRGGMPCHGTFLLHQVSPCTFLHVELKDEEICFPSICTIVWRCEKKTLFIPSLLHRASRGESLSQLLMKQEMILSGRR